MPLVTRLGDKSTSDPCGAPSRPTAQGSKNVITNGKKTVRVSDKYEPHSCPNESQHTTKASRGSGTVIINGKKVHRVQDDIECGSKSAEGSPNVIAGG